MIALLILLFAILIPIDLPGLIRARSWRELTVYSVLITAAFVICLLYILRIPIPNPVRDTQYLVKKLLHLSYD